MSDNDPESAGKNASVEGGEIHQLCQPSLQNAPACVPKTDRGEAKIRGSSRPEMADGRMVKGSGRSGFGQSSRPHVGDSKAGQRETAGAASKRPRESVDVSDSFLERVERAIAEKDVRWLESVDGVECICSLSFDEANDVIGRSVRLSACKREVINRRAVVPGTRAFS